MLRNFTTDPIGTLIGLLYVLPAILIALVMHELAHAYVAWRLGDPTAKYMGRLSFNPLRHLDPIGTLLLVVVGFGWAKPVPIDPRYFKHPRRDDFLVSIAGITVNFILFFVSAMLFLSLHRFAGWYTACDHANVLKCLSAPHVHLVGEGQSLLWYPTYIMGFIKVFATINAALMIFNLLPLPPLDGFHVVNTVILRGSLYMDRRLMLAGQILLVVGLVSGVLIMILTVARGALFTAAAWVFDGIVKLVTHIL